MSPGERVALVGASGAGKSTIANLLLRFYQPQSGMILIDGLEIEKYQRQSLRRRIGVVMQESILIGASIRENIAYGKTRDR
ncbi:MAG: ATP-binding cassette domain-containing protein [Acidobacteria bacterium]|nr:ATP-binding cassette domain-containing protein [Acidobacteriota bacterium]